MTPHLFVLKVAVLTRPPALNYLRTPKARMPGFLLPNPQVRFVNTREANLWVA